MKPQRLALALVALAALTSACGASVHSWVRDDYAAQDQREVKHLALQVRGVPAEQRQLWTLMARRYVNQHRNFILRPAELAHDATLGVACAGQEGVLGLQVAQTPHGGELALQVQGRIQRCRDGQDLWTGRVDGRWASDEPTVAELRAHYVKELGEAVAPYVAPAFLAIKALVATLPQPVISGEDEMEKIELGE